jgi:pyruvate dehydrogenase (quinone)
MHECELLVLLGTDFPYTPFMPVKNKIVQIDINLKTWGEELNSIWGFVVM